MWCGTVKRNKSQRRRVGSPRHIADNCGPSADKQTTTPKNMAPLRLGLLAGSAALVASFSSAPIPVEREGHWCDEFGTKILIDPAGTRPPLTDAAVRVSKLSKQTVLPPHRSPPRVPPAASAAITQESTDGSTMTFAVVRSRRNGLVAEKKGSRGSNSRP